MQLTNGHVVACDPSAAAKVEVEPAPSAREALSLAPGTWNDAGNADRLRACFGKDMRYCHQTKTWLRWDGSRWEEDQECQVVRLARLANTELLKAAASQNDEGAYKFAVRSLNDRPIRGQITLAMSDPEMVIKQDKLDAQPYLLNFTNGTFDIRTGEFREHRKSDYLTKRINFRYIADARADLWQQVLHRAMGAGPDASETDIERAERMVTYLQRAFGYSMTGNVTEKALFLCFGATGNNGKSTILSVIGKLVEEFSVQIDVNSLMAKQDSTNAQSDLSRLRSVRFAKTTEPEQGQVLSEGKLEKLVQGMPDGKIASHRKYENTSEFTETHKLWIDCNDPPKIRSTENAVWNRIRLIHFPVTLSAAEMDHELPQKLKETEAEGILAWLVAGACNWYRNRLGSPPELQIEQAAYRSDMDPLRDFIDDRCLVSDRCSIQSRKLYDAYSDWASEANQARPLENKLFRKLMEGKGFLFKRMTAGVIVDGIGLRITGYGAEEDDT